MRILHSWIAKTIGPTEIVGPFYLATADIFATKAQRHKGVEEIIRHGFTRIKTANFLATKSLL
jgi:hypothetical protein